MKEAPVTRPALLLAEFYAFVAICPPASNKH